MNLGEQILIQRRRSGLSQSDLAKILKIRRSTISDWETGKRVPLLKNISALEDTLFCVFRLGENHANDSKQ